MFRHLLVPLDGSRLAEAVLPAAASLARTLGASITLLHVVENRPPKAVHGEHHLSGTREAWTYLEALASGVVLADLKVTPRVHGDRTDQVAGAIAADARSMGADLVVMCTHGWGGLGGWIYGRIAERLVRFGGTPVLLIQPGDEAEAARFACRRLLVPLDGRAEHERGLTVATGLARACSAHLHLLVVIHLRRTLTGASAATARLLPGATTALLDLSRQSVQAYLDGHARRLRQEGLATGTEIRRGDPVKAIVSAASRLEVDVIVMGTHARVGMDAFWTGSVAPRVSKASRLPLLLVPLGEAG